MKNLRLLLVGFFFIGIAPGGWYFFLPPPPVLHYVNASTGLDSNSGASSGSAWKTLSFLSTEINNGTVGPCDTVFATGYFADQLSLINTTAVTSATTTPYQLPSSGNASCQLTINGTGTAIIDAGDIEAHTWTQLGSTPVYQATFTAYPKKLYVDDNNLDVPRLIEQTNAVGQYSSTASLNAYDLVNNGYGTAFAQLAAGSSMTVGGPYAITCTGGGGATQATGAFYATSASAIGSIALTNSGSYYASTPTCTGSGSGGTPPTFTLTVLQNQWMVDPGVAGQVGVAPGSGYPYQPVFNPTILNDSQKFSDTNSGLQNVTATPASWYVTPCGSSCWTVYVHLVGGDSPASHTIKATHRDYNVLLSSVDYVTVTGFTLEHANKIGAYNLAAQRSDLGGNYRTGEYNQIANSNIFGCANVGTSSDTINPSLARTNALQGCIVWRPGGETGPDFLRINKPAVLNNHVGTVDDSYALRGNATDAGIIGSGIDGTAPGAYGPFTPFAMGNTVSTTNTPGIYYNAINLTLTTQLANLGGEINYNTVTNSIECFTFGTANSTSRFDHNFCHDAKAEGLQTGGPSVTSNAANPIIIDHNVISNLGIHPSTVGYNGEDCNGATAGALNLYLINNTVFNTADAGITMEGGCSGSTLINNIISMKANIAQTGTNVWPFGSGNGAGGTNGSSFFYYVGANVSGVAATGGSGMAPGTYNLVFTGGSTYNTLAVGTATVAANGVTVTTNMGTVGGDYVTPPVVTFATSPGGTPAILTPIMSGPSSRLNINWSNNSVDAACTGTPTAGCSGRLGRYNCSNFGAFMPSPNMLCEDNPPQFVNAVGGSATSNDLRLATGSPDCGSGLAFSVAGFSSDADRGAIPCGSAFPFVVPAYPTTIGPIYQLAMIDASRFVLARNHRW